MLELDNRTAYSAGMCPGWSRDARFQMTVVIKQTLAFDTSGRVLPLEPASPIVEADRYHGSPGRSSLAVASEAAPFKQGGELLLGGTAHPPGKGPAFEVTVGLDHGPGEMWWKPLMVTGPRTWQRTWLGVMPGDAGAATALQLSYEEAFGGIYGDSPGEAFNANPVGRGHHPRTRKAVGQAMPRIEWPNRLVRRPSDTRPPAGFGPLPAGWSPRVELGAITGGDGADANGCPHAPGAPADLHNTAPADQRFPAPFRGGETLYLKGFFPETAETVRLTLPDSAPVLRLVDGGEGRAVEAILDTLIVDTDRRHIHRVWRAGLPWSRVRTGRAWLQVREPPQSESDGDTAEHAA